MATYTSIESKKACFFPEKTFSWNQTWLQTGASWLKVHSCCREKENHQGNMLCWEWTAEFVPNWLLITSLLPLCRAPRLLGVGRSGQVFRPLQWSVRSAAGVFFCGKRVSSTTSILMVLGEVFFVYRLLGPGGGIKFDGNKLQSCLPQLFDWVKGSTQKRCFLP